MFSSARIVRHRAVQSFVIVGGYKCILMMTYIHRISIEFIIGKQPSLRNSAASTEHAFRFASRSRAFGSTFLTLLQGQSLFKWWKHGKCVLMLQRQRHCHRIGFTFICQVFYATIVVGLLFIYSFNGILSQKRGCNVNGLRQLQNIQKVLYFCKWTFAVWQ